MYGHVPKIDGSAAGIIDPAINQEFFQAMGKLYALLDTCFRRYGE
jgi:hypothetical protein